MPPEVESIKHGRTPAHAGSTSSAGSAQTPFVSFRLGHMQYRTITQEAADLQLLSLLDSNSLVVTVYVPSGAQAQQSR